MDVQKQHCIGSLMLKTFIPVLPMYETTVKGIAIIVSFQSGLFQMINEICYDLFILFFAGKPTFCCS